jgi:predicted DNA-binding protein (MmcQ/YjbR family)
MANGRCEPAGVLPFSKVYAKGTLCRSVGGARTVNGSTMESLRRVALRLPGAKEGVACEGTSLESRTIKVSGKAFLFLRKVDARLKLDASIKDAVARSSKDSAHCSAGAHGWVLVKFEGNTIPADVLEHWVKESYELFAGGRVSKSTAKQKKPKSSRRKPAAGR